MFPQKFSLNIDSLAKIHRNAFPWQPAIMGNKASSYYSLFQISLPWLHLFFYNACPRYLKSRRDLLYKLLFRLTLWRKKWHSSVSLHSIIPEPWKLRRRQTRHSQHQRENAMNCKAKLRGCKPEKKERERYDGYRTYIYSTMGAKTT